MCSSSRGQILAVLRTQHTLEPLAGKGSNPEPWTCQMFRTRSEAARQVQRESVQGYPAYEERHPLGPYSRTMPRVLGGSQRGGRFRMGEVPL